MQTVIKGNMTFIVFTSPNSEAQKLPSKPLFCHLPLDSINSAHLVPDILNIIFEHSEHNNPLHMFDKEPHSSL